MVVGARGSQLGTFYWKDLLFDNSQIILYCSKYICFFNKYCFYHIAGSVLDAEDTDKLKISSILRKFTFLCKDKHLILH